MKPKNPKPSKPISKLTKESKAKIVEEETVAYGKLTAADWVRPGRPATDEEIDEMLDEAEKSPSIPFEHAKRETLNQIEKWTKKKSLNTK